MSYPKIIKEAALEKLFHTDLSLHHIADELGSRRLHHIEKVNRLIIRRFTHH